MQKRQVEPIKLRAQSRMLIRVIQKLVELITVSIALLLLMQHWQEILHRPCQSTIRRVFR
ncbi:hypothetical protein CSB95_6774 [Pseudomonas aeruginosa]|nr:hypothetical protein CSC29_6207 [Pseudomonas aeruginosa]PRW19482.1 hypothetical protein CSB95_6774 [Pseudomonas aeruginosa]